MFYKKEKSKRKRFLTKLLLVACFAGISTSSFSQAVTTEISIDASKTAGIFPTAEAAEGFKIVP